MKKLAAFIIALTVALVAFAAIPSRSAVSVTTASTELFRQALSGSVNNISVTVQNPSSNGSSVEIAWDDVDTPLVAGTGQILAPGDWRTLKSIPVNSSGNAGVLAISLGSTVSLRVIVAATGN